MDLEFIFRLIPVIVGILTISWAVRRFIKEPSRPENDPYKDTQFGENGTVEPEADSDTNNQ